MAVTASGLYYATFAGALQQTIALDLNAETHKVALFTNTLTPAFTTDTAYGVAPYNANETSGGSWAAGGPALTGTSVTDAGSGLLTFDATDVSVATTTITNARCALIYADALAGNNAIVLVNFTSDYSTSNGTFAITWAGAGIFTIDLTP